MSDPDVDTTNKYLVSMRRKEIVIQRPSTILSPDDALNLAAWLVALAEPLANHHFSDVLEAVTNT